MNHERATALAERMLEAWNSQDVDRVLACYTPGARYRDPNTHGFVDGADAMRSYLTELFGRWQMHGDRMHRNDVYFDRAKLAPLLAGQPAQAGAAVR